MDLETKAFIIELDRKINKLTKEIINLTQKIEGSKPKFVSVAQFSSLTGVNKNTVHTWIKNNKLKSAGAKNETKRIPYSEVIKHLPYESQN